MARCAQNGRRRYSMRGRSQVPRHETTMFAPEHSMWIRLAPIPTARFRFPTVVVDGVLFAFGGSEVCTTSQATGETDCPANALASVEVRCVVCPAPVPAPQVALDRTASVLQGSASANRYRRRAQHSPHGSTTQHLEPLRGTLSLALPHFVDGDR